MGRALKEKFTNLSIRYKIMLLLYAVILAMFFILFFVIMHAAEGYAGEETQASASEIVAYNALLVEKEQQYLYGMAAYYAAVPEVQELVTAESVSARTHLLQELSTVSQSGQNLLSLTFYNREGGVAGFNSIDGSSGPIPQDPSDTSRPFHALLSGTRTSLWEYIAQGSDQFLKHDNSPKICLWHAIRDNRSWMPIGAMAITLDSRKLFPSDTDNTGTSIYLVDSQKRQVFERSRYSNQFAAQHLDTLLDGVAPYYKTGSFGTRLEKEDYYVVYQKIPNTSFIVFSLTKSIPFLWRTNALTVSAICAMVLCLILGVPILMVVSSFLTRPLNKLMAAMEHMQSGEAVECMDFQYRDEIGRIGSIFDRIVQENQILTEKNYLLTIHNQAAELAKLQAQINPHFIYNTLNTIQWTALDKGDEEIAELAHSVGQVFRLSLSQGNDFITLAEEQELLCFYLDLQQRRFHERLAYTMDFAPELLEVQVPKLLIQPLVENASVHGARDAHTTVHIGIQVWQQVSGRVHICVTDDGQGIPPDILQQLPDRLTQQTSRKIGSHFALKNIAKRLELYYGGDYIFIIQSELGQGTTIHIEFPFQDQIF